MLNKSFILLLKRLVLFLIAYQITRLLFYFFNKELFTTLTLTQLIGGLRFDLAALGYINIVFGILYLFPHKIQTKIKYQKFLKISFYTVNILAIGTNFIDFEYYKFTNKRSTFALIKGTGMEQEIPGLLQSFMVQYWYIPISFIVLSLILWYLMGDQKLGLTFKKFKPSQVALLLLTVGFLFLLGRGGFQKKPLRIVDANQYALNSNVAVILNTPFTILKTLSNKEKLENYTYFTAQQLNKIFNPIVKTQYPTQNNKNVVVLILESFGEENLNIGQTPFLDSLALQSLQFKNAYANGRVSIDAVPSIISSIPSLMNNSIISSSFAINKIKALPEVLKNHNYHTSFFHGAFNGSQNFDQYCKVAGFDSYYGKNEYQGPESFDGKWGVFDEDFLQFFAKEITSFKEPFFTTLFTISSHPPYVIPDKYLDTFPKGTNEIHETIAYSDNALKLFFETAKTKPWFNNTLFIITADHTSAVKKSGFYNTSLGQFKIPLLFFSPAEPHLKGVNLKNMQQIDIYPSILDYLNIKDQILTYGKSYKSSKDFVINYSNNIYNLIQDDFYLAFDGKKTIGLYHLKNDKLLKNNLMNKNIEVKDKMEQFIKAYVQSFNYRMNHNELTIPNQELIKIAKK